MRTFRLGDASPLAVLVVAVTALGAVVVPPRANTGNDVAAAGDRLQPLRFLAGWRWQGTFPDSENVYDRAFIRDRHLVRGARPDYRGEIQYGWNPKTGTITHRYWTSAVSDGEVVSDIRSDQHLIRR